MDFGFRSHLKGQNYLIFKSSSIWLSFTLVESFLPVFNYLFVFLSTQSFPIFSRQKNPHSWDSLPDRAFQSGSGALLWRPHTSVSSKDDFLPQGPWEVVIKCRLCGKITGGHFSVTPYSGNPKMNFNYQQPLAKECRWRAFQRKSNRQWKIDFRVSHAQLWIFPWYLFNKPALCFLKLPAKEVNRGAKL